MVDNPLRYQKKFQDDPNEPVEGEQALAPVWLHVHATAATLTCSCGAPGSEQDGWLLLQHPHQRQATSNDEGLKDDEKSSSREEKKEEWREKAEENKIKKPKKLNPFMPRVKAKIVQRQAQDGAAGKPSEHEPPSRSVFDQLEDFRMAPSQPEDSQDVEDLMDWWNTVESWEDMLQVHDMTEKEEAKVFAGTAEKVQKGIRVFNELFSERAESLWQHVIDLNAIADSLDKFNKNTKIAQITGGSTSAIGGGIENLRRFDLIKMKKNTYNQDFPALTSQFYEDGAMAGKAILINANEIMHSKELKKGAKSEFAAKIREVAMQLHEGLVELNSIREELQSTRSENK
uniref:Apolipoprotein L, 1 n=1 Tax=Nothobranchius rachovii TaxID=451742 RepID=A0A1A8RFV5_9TELE